MIAHWKEHDRRTSGKQIVETLFNPLLKLFSCCFYSSGSKFIRRLYTKAVGLFTEQKMVFGQVLLHPSVRTRYYVPAGPERLICMTTSATINHRIKRYENCLLSPPHKLHQREASGGAKLKKTFPWKEAKTMKNDSGKDEQIFCSSYLMKSGLFHQVEWIEGEILCAKRFRKTATHGMIRGGKTAPDQSVHRYIHFIPRDQSISLYCWAIVLPKQRVTYCREFHLLPKSVNCQQLCMIVSREVYFKYLFTPIARTVSTLKSTKWACFSPQMEVANERAQGSSCCPLPQDRANRLDI